MNFKKIIISVTLCLSACGPVNKAPSATASTGNIQTSLNGSVQPSTSNQFLVLTSVASTTAAAPALGDNTVTVRFIYSATLQPVTSSALANVTYWMPDMPQMGKTQAAGVRQADGSFTAPLFLSMSGRWHFTVDLQDGAAQDQYVFETTL